jgi:metal-sulfur cluster biosynthetic enzyme
MTTDRDQTVAGREEFVAEIRRTLDTIGDPCSVAHGSPMGLDEMGLIESVAVDEEGGVDIGIRLTSPCCMMLGYFEVEATKRVGTLPGVSRVKVHSDQGLDWRPEMIKPEARRRRREKLIARGMPSRYVDAVT